MTTTPTQHPSPAAPAAKPPRRGIELPAMVAITWSLSCGLVAGGAGVAVMIAAERMSAHLMLTTSTLLFLMGALFGLAHGTVLGILGRPEGWSAGRAGGALLHGMLYLVPALLLGWLLAGWVAAMPIALLGRHYLAAGISLLAWIAMAAVVPSAVSRGIEAARLAYRRWDDGVLGTSLVGLVLAALVVVFLVDPPSIWFAGVTLSRTGGVLFAGFLAFWVYGPLITLAMHLAKRIRPDLVTLPAVRVVWRRGAASLGMALAVGVVLAAVSVPFFRGATGLSTGVDRLGFLAALALAVSSALTDELMFRLVVMTVAFVAALRVVRGDRTLAAMIAIATATVLDLLLHSPAVPGLGLPGMTVLLSYVAVRIAIPAAMFGYLYWRRGLGTAVAAHMTTNTVLLLLAA